MTNNTDITLYGAYLVPEQTFSYTGGAQTWTVPADGVYKLEVWGAQGGFSNYSGGAAGGYTWATFNLNRGDVLYIVCGGAGTYYGTRSGAYNGGGASSEGDGWSNVGDAVWGGGGGATHIGRTNTLLASTSDTNLYVVAGGGGGRMHYKGWDSDGVYEKDYGGAVGNAGPGNGTRGNGTGGCGGGYQGGGLNYDSSSSRYGGGTGYINPSRLSGSIVNGGNSGSGRAKISMVT